MLPDSILVFDTETTGLPLFKKSPDHPDQPHLVQLAYVVFHQGKPVRTNAVLIDSNFESSPEAERVHRKTMILRRLYGQLAVNALDEFLTLANRVELVVAHNFKFDALMIERTIRYFVCNDFLPRNVFCTMLATTDLIKLPGPYGFKWPKLDEAYRHFIHGAGIVNAHDALADVNACAEILFHLEKNGYIHHDSFRNKYVCQEPDPSYADRLSSVAFDGAVRLGEDLRDQHIVRGRLEGEGIGDGAQGNGNTLGYGTKSSAPDRELGVALRGAGGGGLEGAQSDGDPN